MPHFIDFFPAIIASHTRFTSDNKIALVIYNSFDIHNINDVTNMVATIRVSDENKQKLDALLAKKIGETKNPSLTMDEVITALLFLAEVQA